MDRCCASGPLAFDPRPPQAALLCRHGGRVGEAARLFPDAPHPWLDLSTGLNSQPYPARPADRTARARLPDLAYTAALEAAAARAFGVAPVRTCATPGLEAGLHRLAQVLDARSVTVVGPTYRGHAEAWRAAGVEVATVANVSAAQDTEATAVVLVNPNNPDGRRLPAYAVRDLAEQLREAGRWLIVDEAFVEAEPELSVAPHAGERLIVMRSFGKFYGLAGLRLGFVLGEPELLARMRVQMGEWPVSADAIAAGLQAYPDLAWAERTRRRLQRDGRRLDALLQRAGLEVVGGTPLFRLAEADDAPRRFARLARRGVLTRPFEDMPRRLRFGLPPQGGWKRLETALMESAA